MCDCWYRIEIILSVSYVFFHNEVCGLSPKVNVFATPTVVVKTNSFSTNLIRNRRIYSC